MAKYYVYKYDESDDEEEITGVADALQVFSDMEVKYRTMSEKFREMMEVWPRNILVESLSTGDGQSGPEVIMVIHLPVEGRYVATTVTVSVDDDFDAVLQSRRNGYEVAKWYLFDDDSVESGIHKFLDQTISLMLENKGQYII